MRIAYADPPYPGQSKKRYRTHPDYDGEVNHRVLAGKLHDYDGWCLHTSSVALASVLEDFRYADWTMPDPHIPGSGDFRIMAWVKPFAAFKPNVPIAYAWEPVIVREARKPTVKPGYLIYRDFVSENITLKKGLTGVKPEGVCKWLFECMGMQAGDEIEDLYPGTGSVTDAWVKWRSEVLEINWRLNR